MNSKYALNIGDVENTVDATREPTYSADPAVGTYASDEAAALKRALVRFSDSAEGTVGSEYRFRAECQFDADLFMHAISAYVDCRWTIIPDDSGYHLPDVEVQFRLTRAIRPRSLLWAANAVVDGHVMAQTLALAEHYTGKRDMYLHPDIHLIELLPSEDEMRQIYLSSDVYAERLQCLADQADEHAARMFRVKATAYTNQAPANDEADWFDGMLKLSA